MHFESESAGLAFDSMKGNVGEANQSQHTGQRHSKSIRNDGFADEFVSTMRVFLWSGLFSYFFWLFATVFYECYYEFCCHTFLRCLFSEYLCDVFLQVFSRVSFEFYDVFSKFFCGCFVMFFHIVYHDVLVYFQRFLRVVFQFFYLNILVMHFLNIFFNMLFRSFAYDFSNKNYHEYFMRNFLYVFS